MTNHIHDIDAAETAEWLESLASVLRNDGQDRAQFILSKLNKYAVDQGLLAMQSDTAYANTISSQKSHAMDLTIEKRIRDYARWNAMAMVVRQGQIHPELGGHIASYASAATLYEVGFNHFFHARTTEHLGDLVFFQGHSSPGIYARAFLEGRLSTQQLDNFRKEVAGNGLSSYPHPWLMPDFWEFPTVSMGLGPLQAIYQAKFDRYMENRGMLQTKRKIWVFLGDGEVDEPESLCAISLAAREKLDNLIFVVNCNLQRLDGPVRGNHKIIQELASIFSGAKWHVIKLIWGSKWDSLLAQDHQGILQKRMDECVDGDYQNFQGRDGKYIREQFFGKYPELMQMVAEYSDEEIRRLNRGGHDPEKVYTAYHQAISNKDAPTVILAKTVKGFGMGATGESKNTTHNKKKMSLDEIKAFRDRFNIPISDDAIADIPYCRFAEDSQEAQYLHKHRRKLGGYLPVRKVVDIPLAIPTLDSFSTLLAGSGDRKISTTMAVVRMLSILLKDQKIGKRIVPITPDESRTFGMESLFRQYGIYSSIGQLYTPEDADNLLYYKEATDGQILAEGITEAGALASWIAAGTSHACRNQPMIPIYIFYSMFGFQRVGDLIWAAADMRARGFLIGATAGRTTLAGEGLQHNDGHSLVMSSLVPNCISYDPAFSYEIAVIIQHGLNRMYQQQEDVFYYITAMNENYEHPMMPEGCAAGIIKGMYALSKKSKAVIELLGSGAILMQVIKAANYLEKTFNIVANVWSVTSFTELKREADIIERDNRLSVDYQNISYVKTCLNNNLSVIAATDYVRAYADQIRQEINQEYIVLGTDGFGRSDTRESLRNFYEVDCNSIVFAALTALHRQDIVSQEDLVKAIDKLGINTKNAPPFTI